MFPVLRQPPFFHFLHRIKNPPPPRVNGMAGWVVWCKGSAGDISPPGEVLSRDGKYPKIPGSSSSQSPLIRSSSQAPHHSLPPKRQKLTRSAARPLPNVTAGAGSRWGPRMATFPPWVGKALGVRFTGFPLRGEAVERRETDEGALFSGPMWLPGDISLCGATAFFHGKKGGKMPFKGRGISISLSP